MKKQLFIPLFLMIALSGYGQPASGNNSSSQNTNSNSSSGSLQPGLEKRDTLPPGLEKRDTLPPGLSRRSADQSTQIQTNANTQLGATTNNFDTNLSPTGRTNLTNQGLSPTGSTNQFRTQSSFTNSSNRIDTEGTTTTTSGVYSPATQESQTVTMRIRQAIQEDTSLAGVLTGLGIIVNEGVVTLTGYVSSEQERIEIERIVQRQPGIVEVNNQLQVGVAVTADDNDPQGQVTADNNTTAGVTTTNLTATSDRTNANTRIYQSTTNNIQSGVSSTNLSATSSSLTNSSRIYTEPNNNNNKSGLPPGLEKRDTLPPGLEKRDQLPPGLDKRSGDDANSPQEEQNNSDQ